MSRDCGSDIHQMIEDGSVKFVQHMDKESDRWCVGFYTIDFESNVFITEYGGTTKAFSLDSLPTDEAYVKFFEADEDED